MNEASMKIREPNNQEVVIGLAVSSDAEAIVEVLRQTWFATYPNAKMGITDEDIRQRVEGQHGERIPKNIERWRNTIETSDDSHTVYIARLDGKVVGMAAPGIFNGQRRVGALYVLPGAQGKGIGSKLLQKILEWHDSQEDVYLAVASYNQNAINFYKRFGFEQTARSIRDEGDVYGNKEIPEIEMVRRVIP